MSIPDENTTLITVALAGIALGAASLKIIDHLVRGKQRSGELAEMELRVTEATQAKLDTLEKVMRERVHDVVDNITETYAPTQKSAIQSEIEIRNLTRRMDKLEDR